MDHRRYPTSLRRVVGRLRKRRCKLHIDMRELPNVEFHRIWYQIREMFHYNKEYLVFVRRMRLSYMHYKGISELVGYLTSDFFPNLRILDLSDNYIEDLSLISDLPNRLRNLHTLSLRNCGLTNLTPLMKGLRDNTNLIKLDLSSSRGLRIDALRWRYEGITDINSIAEMLRYNTTLRALNIDDSNVTDMPSLCEALKFNASLVVLEIGYYTNISKDDIANIQAMIDVNYFDHRLNLKKVDLLKLSIWYTGFNS